MKLYFKLEKETKGALRYQEVDEAGNEFSSLAETTIGTLYVRKLAMRKLAEDGPPIRLDVKMRVGTGLP